MTALIDIQRLVECESPTDDLASCNQVVDLAIEIANKLLKTPSTKINENGRPVFWWGAKNPKIVLLCHLDTVWPKGSFKPTWKIEADTATGPGVFDMKAGFIQALYAVSQVSSAQDNVALVATAVTTVPVSKPVIAIFNASAKSTLLSAGTGSATGAVAAVPPVAADPFTVNVVVAAAFADGTKRTVLVNAAALTSAIFFSDIT